MRLDSVRELKMALLDTNVAPLSDMKVSAMKLGIAARSTRALTPTPRTVALGVAPRGKDYRLAVRFQNRSLAEAELVETIRKRAHGEVDVRFVGRVVKRAPWYQSRQRPLAIGSSIGHFRITAGTLGCFVEQRATKEPFILSNNHVLADENRGKPGDVVIQPGDIDGGRKKQDYAGRLAAFVRLQKSKANLLDCAIASLRPGIEYVPGLLRGIGTLKGLGPEITDTGIRVRKVGRTTGVTSGRVTAFELDNVVVEYDFGNARFDDQIEIESASGSESFCLGGDSGSLIVDGSRRAVALLFAGSETGGKGNMGLTFANPIRAVLDALKIDLLIA